MRESVVVRACITVVLDSLSVGRRVVGAVVDQDHLAGAWGEGGVTTHFSPVGDIGIFFVRFKIGKSFRNLRTDTRYLVSL